MPYRTKRERGLCDVLKCYNMNPLKWLLWKISQQLWDLAYKYNYDTLLYYSCLGIIRFSPTFNDDAYFKMQRKEEL